MYIQPSKPILNKNHKHAQMEFSEWAKKKLEKGGIFIYLLVMKVGMRLEVHSFQKKKKKQISISKDSDLS